MPRVFRKYRVPVVAASTLLLSALGPTAAGCSALAHSAVAPTREQSARAPYNTIRADAGWPHTLTVDFANANVSIAGADLSRSTDGTFHLPTDPSQMFPGDTTLCTADNSGTGTNQLHTGDLGGPAFYLIGACVAGSQVEQIGVGGFYARWDVQTSLGSFSTGSSWSSLPPGLQQSVIEKKRETIGTGAQAHDEIVRLLGPACTKQPWLVIISDVNDVVTNVELYLDPRTCTGTQFPPPQTCAPYIVIDSRGSGSNDVVSAPGRRFLDELRRLKAPQYVGVVRNEYPAKGWTTFLGAILQLPLSYYNSVTAGTRSLREILAKETALCGPKTKFYLTGYSQGAQISADVYQRAWYPNVVGVALFGDPYFNSFDRYVDRGSFFRGLDGNLGTRPAFDKTRRVHVLSFCHRYDPICQGGALTAAQAVVFQLSRHTNYDSKGEPEQAARYFSTFG